MKNPNHLNEPNEAIPEVNPVVPESNQVVDIHDPNEMVDIPDDIDLVDWNGYLRKGQKTKPKRQNQTRNGKAGKRQSQSPSPSVEKSTQVNPEAKSQEKKV
ncbi:hypothetical protein Tco_0621128 [Tanacetum coccineum]